MRPATGPGRHRWGQDFLSRAGYRYIPCMKKFDKIDLAGSSCGEMADSLKNDYYQKNREARLSYQRAYYRKNRNRIIRAREIRKEEDPKWSERQRAYNRAYYIKNRAKIRLQREKKASEGS